MLIEIRPYMCTDARCDGVDDPCWKERVQQGNWWKLYVWNKLQCILIIMPSLLDRRQSSPLIPVIAFVNGVFSSWPNVI